MSDLLQCAPVLERVCVKLNDQIARNWELLAEHSPYKAVSFDVRPGGIGWHGNAILVRKSAEVTHRAALAIPMLEPRGAVLAEGRRVLIDDPARFDGVTAIGGSPASSLAASALSKIESGPISSPSV